MDERLVDVGGGGGGHCACGGGDRVSDDLTFGSHLEKFISLDLPTLHHHIFNRYFCNRACQRARYDSNVLKDEKYLSCSAISTLVAAKLLPYM